MMCAGTKLCCPDTRGLRTTAWVTLVPEENSKTSLPHQTHVGGFVCSGYIRKQDVDITRQYLSEGSL